MLCNEHGAVQVDELQHHIPAAVALRLSEIRGRLAEDLARTPPHLQLALEAAIRARSSVASRGRRLPYLTLPGWARGLSVTRRTDACGV